MSINDIAFNYGRTVALVGLLMAFGAGQMARPATGLRRSSGGAGGASVRNSWRGITPLQSSASDVARAIGLDSDLTEAPVSGPFKVEGGEVTFSFLTPSIAKIYRAPRTMVGKVFTIYFKPDGQVTRNDLKLGASFKQCVEQQTRIYYYLVNEAGVAYRFRRDDDAVETIIYQPSRTEVRRLAVNTECVF
ncbi:MAG TPA: hypothetical protein VJZ26_09300 [Blastocatellia bacterium]|nr:hypothetical protein [Blastocatellia bacterium]